MDFLPHYDSRLKKSTRRQWVHTEKTDDTWPKLQSWFEEVEKNPGSFTASHKKGRIYAGVNLRLPGLEQAIYHLKTDSVQTRPHPLCITTSYRPQTPVSVLTTTLTQQLAVPNREWRWWRTVVRDMGPGQYRANTAVYPPPRTGPSDQL